MTGANTSKASSDLNIQSGQCSQSTVVDALGRFLDRTLVCKRDDESRVDVQDREQDFRVFSQRHDSADESSLLEPGTSQSEVSESFIQSSFRNSMICNRWSLIHVLVDH